MEQDLAVDLDWVAVDHFNTGHPHTHIVVRGKDTDGQDLIIARDYMSQGVGVRAGALLTLELGPETELERIAKLSNEVALERLTRLDRTLLYQAKDNVLAISSLSSGEKSRQTMLIGRLHKLKQLGLASEPQRGVW